MKVLGFKLNRTILRLVLATGCVAALPVKEAAAVDVFGYFEFDYSQTLKNGQTGDKSKSGDFDTAFVSIMLQHEVDIYKFFTEVELQHGAEFKGDSAGAVTSSKDAQVVVERGYAEMHFNPYFNVTVGKSMSPTLWKSNHYPTIVKPVSEPMLISKEVISGNYIGPMISGDIGYGFSYNLWTNRSPNNGSAKDTNNAFSRYARLAYTQKFDQGSVAVSYLGGTTEAVTTGTAAVQYKPSSFDLNLSISHFLLWFESAMADGGSGAQGSYAVASYSFDLNGDQELAPFVTYDQFKQDAATGSFANMGYGVTYKPIPNLVHKVEFYQQKNDSTLSSDGFANGDQRIKYQFVYFFN